AAVPQRPPPEPPLRHADDGATAALPRLRQRPRPDHARLRLLGREPAPRALRPRRRPLEHRLHPQVVIHGTLGTTGLRVSRIGLGLAALGRPAYINLGHDADLGADRGVDVLQRQAHTVLDAAWERGIRYV